MVLLLFTKANARLSGPWASAGVSRLALGALGLLMYATEADFDFMQVLGLKIQVLMLVQ